MRKPQFEIVRTDAEQPWHARFRSANGRIVWTTETYHRRRSAERAILTIAGWHRESAKKISAVLLGSQVVEVRHLDLRP